MKAAYFLGNGKFEAKEVTLREPEADEVVVKVAACGVCGTDVHIYHGDKGSADVNPPVILGHEFSGVVEKIGSAVTSLHVGDHVTVDPNIYCGSCHYCKIGKKNLCQNLFAIGVNRDGGFAERCVVPEKQCVVLDKTIPLEYGAMTEPLACCLRGIDIANIRPGDTVCVIGDGAIGLLMVQLAKLVGASKIILSAPIDSRRELGLSLGADAVVNPMKEDLLSRIREEFHSEGADIVIECVGSIQATAQAVAAADRGGTVLLFSVPKPGATYGLSMEDVYHKELKICGSFVNPDTHGRAAALISSGKVRLEQIITHAFPVDQLEEAIHMQMSAESIKVIVKPGITQMEKISAVR